MKKYFFLANITLAFAFGTLPQPIFYNDFNDSTGLGKFRSGHLYTGYSANLIEHHIPENTEWSISFWIAISHVDHKNGITILTTRDLGGVYDRTRRTHNAIKLGVNLKNNHTRNVGFTEYMRKDYDLNQGNLPDYTWTFVTLNYTISEIDVYINGKWDGSYFCTQPFNAAQLFYGQPSDHSYDLGFYFLDEFRLYDKALTKAEILELYHHVPASTFEFSIPQPKRKASFKHN